MRTAGLFAYNLDVKSSKKLLAATTFIVLFFSVSLLQGVGEREDWPFGYFGMFKRAMVPENIMRVDIEIQTPQGEQLNVYGLGGDPRVIREKFYLILATKRARDGYGVDLTSRIQDQEVLKAIQYRLALALKWDVLPILERRQIADDAIIKVRYRYWKHFTWEHRNDPDLNYVFLEARKGNLK